MGDAQSFWSTTEALKYRYKKSEERKRLNMLKSTGPKRHTVLWTLETAGGVSWCHGGGCSIFGR